MLLSLLLSGFCKSCSRYTFDSNNECEIDHETTVAAESVERPAKTRLCLICQCIRKRKGESAACNKQFLTQQYHIHVTTTQNCVCVCDQVCLNFNTPQGYKLSQHGPHEKEHALPRTAYLPPEVHISCAVSSAELSLQFTWLHFIGKALHPWKAIKEMPHDQDIERQLQLWKWGPRNEAASSG